MICKVTSQTKPDVRDCLFLTYYTAEKTNNLLLPLTSFQIQEFINHDGRIIINYNNKDINIPKNCNIAIAITNDPTLFHAGSPTQIGCSMLRWTMFACLVKAKKNQIIIEGKNMEFDIRMAEKTEPEEYDFRYMEF